MAEVINVVRGDEWVFPASLKADGVLVAEISAYTITAEIIRASDGAALLSLTEGNGRIEIGETADDITFRIAEADTSETSANPIPLGQLSKLRISVVDSAGKTTRTSCWLNVERDGGEDTAADLTLNFSTANLTLNFTSAEGPAGAAGVASVAGLTGVVSGDALRSEIGLTQGLGATDSPTFAGGTYTDTLNITPPTDNLTGLNIRLNSTGTPSSGGIILNANTEESPAMHHEATMVIIAPDSKSPTLEFMSFGTQGQGTVIGLRHRGTMAEPLPAGADDILLRLNGRGWDGVQFNSFTPQAAIEFRSSEDVDATHHGGYLLLRSTPKGFNNNTQDQERVRIQSSGAVSVGEEDFNETDPGDFGILAIQKALSVPKLYPATDSTTAIQITKADKTTAIATWDTTNGRLGIGTDAPSTSFHLYRESASADLTVESDLSTGVASLVAAPNTATSYGSLAAVGSGANGANLFNVALSARLSSGPGATAGLYIISVATGSSIKFAAGGAASTNVNMILKTGLALGDSTFVGADPGAGCMAIQNHFSVGGAQVTMSALPTSNPGVAGRLWNDGGTLKVSAG